MKARILYVSDRIKRLACALLASLLGLLLIFRALCLASPFPHAHIDESERSGATQVLDRDAGLIAWRVDAQDAWRVPVRLEEVSPWVVAATIAAEDQRFHEHDGVDLYAVARALSQNLRHGRRVSGASTITMQTIRLLVPRERTWSAKLIETFRALQLESEKDKGSVLQVYLNLAPYGGNVVGIEAAARHWFGKPARELTLGEAALLAGIPQSPARFHPARHLDRALQRRAYVLARMQDLGYASLAELETALREPIALTKTPIQTQAPHLAELLVQRQGDRGGILHATLHPALQSIALDVTRRRAQELLKSGIDGLAAVVVDVEASALVALVGNARPGDPLAGMVNAATRPRQPGSLLKPFLYGLAYERGHLTPRELVYDLPGRWAGYQPENIDRDYLGPLPAGDALRLSRNVPAVRLLEALTPPALQEKLARMGLVPAWSTQQYGLSLALGTAEMNLLELTNAYACLARLGEYRALRMLQDEPPVRCERVLSPGACWLVLRSLQGWEEDDPRAVWKTGTSWNHRDAWAIAITPRYAVGIWCGNLSGRGHGGLVGAEAALPTALELLGRLRAPDAPGWSRPRSVVRRTVCALSGTPAGRHCRETAEAEALAGVSAAAVCHLHRTRSPQSAADAAGPAVVWPAEMAALLHERDSVTGNAPAPPPALQITQPRPDAEYVLAPDASAGGTLAFVTSTGRSEPVHWYLNGEWLGVSSSGEPLHWRMEPGWHDLTTATASGQQARLHFRVREYSR